MRRPNLFDTRCRNANKKGSLNGLAFLQGIGLSVATMPEPGLLWAGQNFWTLATRKPLRAARIRKAPALLGDTYEPLSLCPWVIEGTNTTLAGRVAGDIEGRTEFNCPWAIQGLRQVGVSRGSDGGVKEAWTQASIDFEHGRNPRGVALRGFRGLTFDSFSETFCEATELFRALPDKPRGDFIRFLVNQCLNFYR